MGSFIRLFDRRAKLIVAAFVMLASTIVPALVFADQVTERSIQLSSSSVNAQNVSYTVNFKSVGAGLAFVVDFCTNTPLYGEACDAPAGFDVGALTAVPAGFTAIGKVTSGNVNTLRVSGTVAADTAISAEVAGITNPSAAGPLYARIITFDTVAHANAYVPNGTNTGMVDNGGVALSITPTVGVSGAVLESMVFCVAGDEGSHTTPILAGCTKSGGGALPAPTVKLGSVVGNVTVLDPSVVNEGIIFTQLSTNAASGAVVSLKSNTTGCGGLARAGTTFTLGCGIKPANVTNGFDVAANQAKFGVKTGTAAGISGNSNGTLQAAGTTGSTNYYNASTFKMNYVAGDLTGVTSTYGDPLLDSDGKPVNNMGMPITFGASAANDTPAGFYSANLSLIATGKF
jgi:hypothetical protein